MILHAMLYKQDTKQDTHRHVNNHTTHNTYIDAMLYCSKLSYTTICTMIYYDILYYVLIHLHITAYF